MAFTWNTNTVTKNNVCNIINIDNEHEDIILMRVQMNSEIEGCCGQIRNDAIYPVIDSSFSGFQKEALEIINKYIEEENIYSLEYFYGKPGQNFREDGKSISRFELENGLWNFYEKDQFKFSVKDTEELKVLWLL